jgi:hypothetical protein
MCLKETRGKIERNKKGKKKERKKEGKGNLKN